MTVLNRYLIRRNCFLLFSLLFLGWTVYIISDLLQRIDNFMKVGLGASSVFAYFFFKSPLIISQILPAVFLISIVSQLSLMEKNRETVALQTGGISPLSMVRFVIVYGVVWACLQFAFAQVIGVTSSRYAMDIWHSDVKGRDSKNFSLDGLWVTNKNFVIYMKKAWPHQERAEGVIIYETRNNGTEITSSIQAERAETGARQWVLYEVSEILPDTYSYSTRPRLVIPLRQSIANFGALERNGKIAEMNILELNSYIRQLRKSGTNVEMMRTNFHNRFAYAGSLVVMGVIALVIVMLTSNIYKAVALSMVVTFFFHAASGLFSTIGEQGAMNPALAAWTPNILFFTLSCGFLCWVAIKEVITRKSLAASRKKQLAHQPPEEH